MEEVFLNRNKKVQSITIAGMLCAIAVAIPMFMPLKIIIEPASFTLASHVPVFISMFLSVPIAVAVAIGSTFGFLLAGFPPVVVARASSHIIFVVLGAWYLQKNEKILHKPIGQFAFALVTGLLHAAGEILAVIPFYFSNTMGAAYYDKGFLYSVFLLVGIGTIVHSMVDFYLATIVARPMSKQLNIKNKFTPIASQIKHS